MSKYADAVVIGGGIHGCSVAYHLAKRGLSHVVLLEKDYLAACGTGRSAAGIRHQFGTEVNVRLSAASVKMMENLVQELDYPHSIDLMQKGYLMLAFNPSELELFSRNVALQHQIHADCETVILSPEEIHELVDGLNFKEKVDRSLALISDAYEEYGDGLVVANSLGKDSVVVWDLAKRVNPAIRGFIVTTRFKPAATKARAKAKVETAKKPAPKRAAPRKKTES